MVEVAPLVPQCRLAVPFHHSCFHRSRLSQRHLSRTTLPFFRFLYTLTSYEMSSPPPSNILLDPISELETALRTNAFGLDPSTTQIIYPSSFPITSEDKERVITESRSSGSTGEGVIARAEVGLIEGGLAEVVLDRRGYTVRSHRSFPFGR